MIRDRKDHHNTRLQVRLAALYNNKELSGEMCEFHETDSIFLIHEVSFPHEKKPSVNSLVEGPVCRIWMQNTEYTAILIIMFSLICNCSWIFVLHCT